MANLTLEILISAKMSVIQPLYHWTTHHQDNIRADDSFRVLPLRQREQNGEDQLTSVGVDLQTRQKKVTWSVNH